MNLKLETTLEKFEIQSDIKHPSWEQSEYHFRQGKKFEHNGDIELAIASYTKAIELNSKHSNAYYHRGILLKESVNVKKGLKDLYRASDLYFEQMNYTERQEALDTISKLQKHTPQQKKSACEKIQMSSADDSVINNVVSLLYCHLEEIPPEILEIENSQNEEFQNDEDVLMREFEMTAEQSHMLCQHFRVSTAVECFHLIEARLANCPGDYDN